MKDCYEMMFEKKESKIQFMEKPASDRKPIEYQCASSSCRFESLLNCLCHLMRSIIGNLSEREILATCLDK